MDLWAAFHIFTKGIVRNLLLKYFLVNEKDRRCCYDLFRARFLLFSIVDFEY